MKDGSYGNADHTSGTGHSGAGGAAKGGGGGGGYTFRNYRSNPNISGNWNTGGAITGFGSLGGGIRSFQQPRSQMGIPHPAASPMAPMVPPQIPPLAPPQMPYPQPGTVTDVFGPNVRMDPGVLAQMLQGLNRPASTFPARPGVSPRVGVVGKDQSRLPQMGGMGGMRGGWSNSGGGFSGGGFGGGGGGGW